MAFVPRAMPIKDGDKVAVHYTGRLADGQVFDSSQGRGPLRFTVGGGDLIPGFDRAVVGLAVGEKATVEIPPEQAYGPRDEDNTQQIPRSMLDASDLEEGQVLGLEAPDGQRMQATVQAVDEEHVTLDFNHFLAGETLIFEIEVVEAA